VRVAPTDAVAVALLSGYLLVLAVLFRDPSAALAAATATPAAAVYFLVLPAGGLLAAGYAALDGPAAVLPAGLAGTYLGVVGVGLAVRAALAPGAGPLVGVAGVAAAALAVVALVAGAVDVFGGVGLGSLAPPTE